MFYLVAWAITLAVTKKGRAALNIFPGDYLCCVKKGMKLLSWIVDSSTLSKTDSRLPIIQDSGSGPGARYSPTAPYLWRQQPQGSVNTVPLASVQLCAVVSFNSQLLQPVSHSPSNRHASLPLRSSQDESIILKSVILPVTSCNAKSHGRWTCCKCGNTRNNHAPGLHPSHFVD